jgi:hypothetical protein
MIPAKQCLCQARDSRDYPSRDRTVLRAPGETRLIDGHSDRDAVKPAHKRTTIPPQAENAEPETRLRSGPSPR